MAIYTGFFDAAFDEATGTYDREYGSADFTGYFGQIVGSGVCVHGNDDSMRVYYDAASKRAVVNPGYLFIRGYWLKNDGLYTVDLADLPAGVYAIRAALNLGTRSITIGQVPKAKPEEYPDALVLAYATVAEGGVTVEDTRGRTDICGLIDAAGSLSVKVDYAIHYIDNEINGKLDQIQQNLQAQEAEIDGKIAEANKLIAKIVPPAIGTVKFSASQNIEKEWLRCDGRFISESDYPELVAALGKLYPSNDKFHLLNTKGVGKNISNTVILNGRLWVFSCNTLKLYGIDALGDSPVIEINTRGDEFFNLWRPETRSPICLSIIPNLTSPGKYHIFIAQFNSVGSFTKENTLLYQGEFSEDAGQIEFTRPFDVAVMTTESSPGSNSNKLPYVISEMANGTERFYMVMWVDSATLSYLDNKRIYTVNWSASGDVVTGSHVIGSETNDVKPEGNLQIITGYNSKNSNEMVSISVSVKGRLNSETIYYNNRGTISENKKIFYKSYDESDKSFDKREDFTSQIPTIATIAGDNGDILFSADKERLYYLNGSSSVGYLYGTGVTPKLPEYSNVFVESAVYLRDKKIYLIFYGTGILFTRDFDNQGYLDTTSVMGVITRFGELRYDEDSGTLYVVGQDGANQVRVAKLVLNNLFDYANDGAWLPLIASDGVPAWIKAKKAGKS